MRINKNVVINQMHRLNIKTQKDLAERMNISSSNLSQLLSDNYQPLKTNVLKIMEVLDVSYEKLTSNQNINTEFEPIRLFDVSDFGFDPLDYKLDEYIDINNTQPNRQYTGFEVFAGAGGLALGLELAGFDSKGLVEIDNHAVATLKHNRPNWTIYEGDINELIDDIDKIDGLDLLSGGYPCQSFSFAGDRKGLEDTRGTLFYPYSLLLRKLKPKTFIAENVKGLISDDNGRTLSTMIETFQDAGYQIQWNLLNAWDYDTAQKRERIFIIGIRNDLYNKQTISYKFPQKKEYRPVLKDILQNIPKSPGTSYSKKKYDVLKLVPPGGSWVDLPEDIAREYLGGSWGAGGGKRGMARRLSWDEPSLTLTTSPSQKQTERCHPEETRPFTVREYARIQSFPDDWEFVGGISSQYKQIGNAVPVNLAKAVGLSLIAYLNQFN